MGEEVSSVIAEARGNVLAGLWRAALRLAAAYAVTK